MKEFTPAHEVEHPRGWRHLYRFDNGLGASVLPIQPVIADLAPRTLDVLMIEWTGPGEDDHAEWKPDDWTPIEEFVREADRRGGDVYYGNGGCELQSVPEHELPELLALISRLR